VTTTGALARRDAVANIGGFEESFQGLHEDQVFYVKLCLRAPVFVSDKTWYRYRRHSESCCAIAEKSGRHHEQRRVFLRWLERYLGDTGLGDNGVWRELKKARWHAEHPALARSANDLRYRVRVKRERLKAAIRKRVPSALYERLRRLRHGTRFVPARGRVDFGDLRRADPISRVFGFDRGRPVDRYYVEDFLARNSEFIRGRVLEIGDDSYTRAFGADRVIETDILSVVENSPRATIIADLAAAGHIPSNTFDCIILTQTLHLIYDVRAAVETLHRILKPGGVLLATMPGISQIDHYDWRESWYWSFTRLSAERLFAGVFTAGKIALETRGNVLAATAFLQGLACDELKPEELDYRDDDYQVVIAVRAHK
jgi:hypothetical protein